MTNEEIKKLKQGDKIFHCEKDYCELVKIEKICLDSISFVRTWTNIYGEFCQTIKVDKEELMTEEWKIDI